VDCITLKTTLKVQPDDFHTRKHWSKTKNGRARACSSLGIEAYINQSVRQGNQRPSGTVLDNALSAILGAIWLDCEGQEQTTATTRRTIWGVLRSIDVALSSPTSSPACGAETLPILSCQSDTLIDQPGKQTGEADLLLGQEQDHIQYFAKEWFEREIGDVRDISNYYTDFIRESEPDIVEAEGTMLGGNHVWNSSFETASRPSTDCHTLGARSGFSSQNLLTQGTNRNTDWENVSTVEIRNSSNDTDVLITGAKRKRLRSKEDKADLIYQEMLESESRKLTYVSENEAEKLQRFLVHPRLDALEGKTSNALRFLWLTIGNWQTISNFKDQLQLARSGPCVYRQSAISSWVALETYNEICRLDNEGSLNVLLRRYHAMKLCEEEPTSGDSHRYIMVHIPNPMVAGERSTPGNPSVISKAYQTDKLVMKIMPSIQHTSPEFKKVRRRVKLLQKLAMRLGVLVNSYGLGILALLPSDASFGELSLTDNVYVSMSCDHNGM
jgi:hypothetical protein